jgi:hypothetical protein
VRTRTRRARAYRSSQRGPKSVLKNSRQRVSRRTMSPIIAMRMRVSLEEEASVVALALRKGKEAKDRSHKRVVGGPRQLLERRSFKRSPRGPVGDHAVSRRLSRERERSAAGAPCARTAMERRPIGRRSPHPFRVGS